VNGIQLRDSQPALNVNWCEMTLKRESDGKVLYQNAFCTSHMLMGQSVPLVTAAGRCRWKTENENHNVLGKVFFKIFSVWPNICSLTLGNL
jgi:hypothetical protein